MSHPVLCTIELHVLIEYFYMDLNSNILSCLIVPNQSLLNRQALYLYIIINCENFSSPYLYMFTMSFISIRVYI